MGKGKKEVKKKAVSKSLSLNKENKDSVETENKKEDLNLHKYTKYNFRNLKYS